MPVSVGRHNLARIRAHLSFTQAELAKYVGCSTSTIKAIEIGKLGLSRRLAARLSLKLGIYDKEWLLKNDLSEPIPSMHILLPQQEALVKGNDTESAEAPRVIFSRFQRAEAMVLLELIHRLFVAIARVEQGEPRAAIEIAISVHLDGLKREKIPSKHFDEQDLLNDAATFFLENPEFLDPELRGLINLQALLKLEEVPASMLPIAPTQVPKSS